VTPQRPLYSGVILQHYRAPRNFGALPAPDAAHEDVNPLCGDRIRMELRFKDGTVEAIRFRGDACAISTASASLLTEMVAGRPLAEAAAVGVAALLVALEAEIRPARMQCVRLPLEVLRAALRGPGEPAPAGAPGKPAAPWGG
jgi:nitrogen fixation NifU-like protein